LIVHTERKEAPSERCFASAIFPLSPGHAAPAGAPGLLVYIMVDDAEAMVQALSENGAEIVQPIGGDPGEITARFRDPGGNIFAIYQEPPQ